MMEREAIALMGDEQKEKCSLCGVEESRHGTCCGESNAKQNISVFNGTANGKCVPLNVNGSNLNLPDEGFVFDTVIPDLKLNNMTRLHEQDKKSLLDGIENRKACIMEIDKDGVIKKWNPNLHQGGK